MIPLKTQLEWRRTAHWMNAARAHDPIFHLHSVLVSELCASFSAYLNLPVNQQIALTRAGLLHDIGKLTIPTTILQKSSPLTADEMQIVRTHCAEGYKILLESGETDEVLLTAARDHHERLDGSGYPRGLRAAEIPLCVRVVALCDVFAAMTEPRSYTEAMTWDKALEGMARKRTRLDLNLFAKFAAMVTVIQKPRTRFNLLHSRVRRARG